MLPSRTASDGLYPPGVRAADVTRWGRATLDASNADIGDLCPYTEITSTLSWLAGWEIRNQSGKFVSESSGWLGEPFSKSAPVRAQTSRTTIRRESRNFMRSNPTPE